MKVESHEVRCLIKCGPDLAIEHNTFRNARTSPMQWIED
jgi:hypothetical protein